MRNGCLLWRGGLRCEVDELMRGRGVRMTRF